MRTIAITCKECGVTTIRDIEYIDGDWRELYLDCGHKVKIKRDDIL